jgi:hypothetical protein
MFFPKQNLAVRYFYRFGNKIAQQKSPVLKIEDVFFGILNLSV